ncbi:hypothetical protein ACER0A_005065 [Haloimpatiens sp. FM7315]|uniref:hypothetical protein n=1 Tax=Haloimpatiens sp. FM7315 TaxID=3298609 RepID=UPI0035A27854
MLKKIISLSLSLSLIGGVLWTCPICTKTAFADEIKPEHSSILRTPGSSHSGTEDIIAQDTVWKYGVNQPTKYGVAVDVASFLLSFSGTVLIKGAAKATLASRLAGGVADLSGILDDTVNIRMDRYKLRGANGKIYYKVYVTYYALNGDVLSSRVAQSC